jgi:molybdopterin converting factor small subunit
MRVTVKLFATLSRFSRGKRAGSPLALELSDAATLGDLIERLKIPPEEPRVLFVNGIIHEPDWKLKDGDEVGLFPAIAGG